MDEVCAAAAGGDNWLDASPTGVTIYNAKLTMGPAGTWMVTDMVGVSQTAPVLESARC